MSALRNGQEIIEWCDVRMDLPDDQETVLVHVPGCGEPVSMGFHDDGAWFCYESGEQVKFPVTHWSKLPAGPFTGQRDSK